MEGNHPGGHLGEGLLRLFLELARDLWEVYDLADIAQLVVGLG